MAAFYIVVSKIHLAGSNRDKSYINIPISARTFTQGTFSDLLLLAPWNDPEAPEFAAEITKQQHDDIRNKVVPLFHDGFSNQPRFQFNTDTQEFGSWLDPEDGSTLWQPGVEIPDDRMIIRVFDGNPTGTGVHIAELEIDEGPGNEQVFIQLFNADDTPNTISETQRVPISGRLMLLDFTNGIANLNIDKNRMGAIIFGSNHAFRILGPGGEKEFSARIFGDTLRLE